MKKRNNGFDILKSICAFMIICIHTPYAREDFFEPFLRMAVPVFFMITGYYYSQVVKNRGEMNQIKKTGLLTVFASALYIVGKPILEILTAGAPMDLIREWLSWKAVMNFLLFNRVPYSSHLWYLMAAIYVLLIMKAVGKTVERKWLYCLIPLLLCCNFMLGNYSVLLFGVQLPTLYSRNFLFMGLPCFLLGDYIYAHKEKQTSVGILIGMLAAGILLTQMEKSLLIGANAYGNKDFFIGTLIMAYASFQLARCDLKIYEHPVGKGLAWCGRKLSAGIYVIHPIIGTIVSKIVEMIGEYVPLVQWVYPYVRILVVAIASAVVTILFLQAKALFGRTKAAEIR